MNTYSDDKDDKMDTEMLNNKSRDECESISSLPEENTAQKQNTAGMKRIRMILEYDGTAYAGWQRQINAVAVQQVVEDALTDLTGHTVTVTGASRTDAGVHALGQVVHFDTVSKIPADKFAFALNTRLPDDIRVVSSATAQPDFHARFQTKGKKYRYVIYDAPHASAMYRNFCAHSIYPLDENLMQTEAQSMIGYHDFAAFAASGSIIKDTRRTVTSCDISRDGHFLFLYVEGDGFLYNMVRILAGTLIAVGSKKMEPGAIERALKSLSRLDLGPTAPPQGLTLMQVYY